jgi:hypothetical protein
MSHLTTSPTATPGERDATQPQERTQAQHCLANATNTQKSGEAEQ